MTNFQGVIQSKSEPNRTKFMFHPDDRKKLTIVRNHVKDHLGEMSIINHGYTSLEPEQYTYNFVRNIFRRNMNGEKSILDTSNTKRATLIRAKYYTNWANYNELDKPDPLKWAKNHIITEVIQTDVYDLDGKYYRDLARINDQLELNAEIYHDFHIKQMQNYINNYKLAKSVNELISEDQDIKQGIVSIEMDMNLLFANNIVKRL